jgi:hypothetical protein
MTSAPQQAGTAVIPPPPAPPSVQAGEETGTGIMTGVPTTREDVSALRTQRRELSDQITSAMRRRESLANALEGATGASRAGIEARIAVLDQRIVELEGQLSSTGKLIAQAPGNLLTSTSSTSNPFGDMRPDLTAISVIFTIFVLGPIAIAMARLIWKRASAPKPAPSFDRENHERLQRLESAVDSIAIEVERVSEGQRFVTKLLAESAERLRVGAPRE